MVEWKSLLKSKLGMMGEVTNALRNISAVCVSVGHDEYIQNHDGRPSLQLPARGNLSKQIKGAFFW